MPALHSTEPSTDLPSYDVLVVGAGPSGLTTAAAAARAGASVLVVDRHSRTSVFPKATGIRPRTMEILRSWGLDAAVRAGAQDLRVAAAIAETLVSTDQQEFSLGAADPETLRRVSPCGFEVCPQDHLEPVLVDHVLGHGGHVWFDTELVGLEADSRGSGQVAELRTDGTPYAVRARFVVGADGAQSTVRELVGIGVDHLGSEGDHVATLFRADLASHLQGTRYALYMVTRPGAEGVFVPSGADGRWVYDREWHPEVGESLTGTSGEDCLERLRAASGVPDLDPEILGVFPWSFEAAVATSIRAGDVFLVGDAAHRTTPRGARGMNTGIADGHNLGWKLAWVARGWAGEALLESYAEERYPVGLRNAGASLSATNQAAPPDLTEDFGIAYRSTVVEPDDTPAPDPLTADGLPAAVPGARAPHAWVNFEDRQVSTIDLFDGRLTVLTGSDDPAWREQLSAAADLGLPLRFLALGADVVDLHGDLAERYRLVDGAVLVRPDGHVASRLSPDADGATLLDAVRRAVGLDATVLTSHLAS